MKSKLNVMDELQEIEDSTMDMDSSHESHDVNKKSPLFNFDFSAQKETAWAVKSGLDETFSITFESTSTSTDEDSFVAPFYSPHIEQISMAEYNRHADDYTQQALRELKASPEYQLYTQQCNSCSSGWYRGEWKQGCKECGGHAMYRPCPICRGHCGKTWKRDVDMSHSMSDAHWDGECGHKKAAELVMEMLTFNSLSEAMEDLHT